MTLINAQTVDIVNAKKDSKQLTHHALTPNAQTVSILPMVTHMEREMKHTTLLITDDLAILPHTLRINISTDADGTESYGDIQLYTTRALAAAGGFEGCLADDIQLHELPEAARESFLDAVERKQRSNREIDAFNASLDASIDALKLYQPTRSEFSESLFQMCRDMNTVAAMAYGVKK